MSFIFLLIAITSEKPMLGNTTINVDTAVFASADRCLEVADKLKKILKDKNKYDTISVECQKKEVDK